MPPVYDYEPGEPLNREAVVMEGLKACGQDIQCLGVTKQGYPKHPLYLKADTKPLPFPWPRLSGGEVL